MPCAQGAEKDEWLVVPFGCLGHFGRGVFLRELLVLVSFPSADLHVECPVRWLVVVVVVLLVVVMGGGVAVNVVAAAAALASLPTLLEKSSAVD